MSERERFLRAFHDARPGVTSRAFARAGSYERLAARVPQGRVLDLACGDGTLLALLGPRAIGVDLSLGELHVAQGELGSDTSCTSCPDSQPVRLSEQVVQLVSDPIVAQARAQQLPFADGVFDAVTCHLAFMLFDDVELVVRELSRVIRPGGSFIALLGGGPTADGDDAFHRFAKLLSMSKSAGPVLDPFRGLGDRRASSEAGWRELFAGWGDITFERWPLDLGGTFDEVWTFLASSYQLRDSDARRIRDQLRAAFPSDPVPCTVVAFCATVTR